MTKKAFSILILFSIPTGVCMFLMSVMEKCMEGSPATDNFPFAYLI